MLQQHRNDLLCPEVLNSSAEFGPERKFRTVGVDSVTHYVLAVCLYGWQRSQQEVKILEYASLLCLSDEEAPDSDFE
jgi:hypothetical protein